MVLIRYKENGTWPVPGYYLEKAFKELGHEVINEYKDGEKPILSITLPPETSVKYEGVPSFYWEIDSTRKQNQEPIGDYDLLFMDNKEHEAYPHAIFLPIAVDENVIKRTKEPKIDVIMLGRTDDHPQFTGYKERQRVMDLLKDKGFSVFVGSGFKGMEYADKLSEGKLILNIPGMTDLNWHFFECTSVGVMLYKDNNRYTDIASADYHYLKFETDDELLAKVTEYVTDNEKWHRMQERGRNNVLSFHTFKHRALTFLSYI